MEKRFIKSDIGREDIRKVRLPSLREREGRVEDVFVAYKGPEPERES